MRDLPPSGETCQDMRQPRGMTMRTLAELCGMYPQPSAATSMRTRCCRAARRS